MSHANLRIYYTENEQFYLTEDKNAIVDDLEEYLNQFKYLEINGFMYLKIKLDLDIKVVLSQEYSHLQANPPLHYVRIYEDEHYFYYFIRDYEWVSENCVRLILRMDTLNTVHLGSDYDFGGENIVKRQHFDRFYKDENGDYVKNINIYPEGIEPTLFKTNETVLYDKSLLQDYRDQSFNLVFMNQDDASSTTKNPVIMLLLGDKPLYFDAPQDEDTWPTTCQGLHGFYITKTTIDNIVSSVIKYAEENDMILPSNSTSSLSLNFFMKASSTSTFGTKSYPDPADVDYEFTSLPTMYVVSSSSSKTNIFTTANFSKMPSTVEECNDLFFLCFEVNVRYNDDNAATFEIHVDASSTSSSTKYSNYIGLFLETGSSSSVVNKRLYLGVDWLYYIGSTQTSAYLGYAGIYNTPLSYQDTISSVEDIDRTDSRIIKIIKLPYIPVDITFKTNYSFNVPDGWSVNEITFSPTGKSADNYVINALQADSSVSSLLHTINFVDSDGNDISSPERELILMEDELSQILSDLYKNTSLTNDWNTAELLETKLLYSSFHKNKIVYDSFSLTIQSECIIYDIEKYDQPLTMTYVCSTAANCHILNILDSKLQYQVEDYSGLFTINRNNDIPLYSNDYLNYLRTGYNYDVKAKNLQIVQNSLSAAGSLASIGTLTNPASVISSAVKGVTNTVTSAIQSEWDLQRTLTEKQYSTASIDGSDDLDLLITYTNNNKYKIITYEAAPYMMKILTKLFQLTGYSCNLYGAPDMTSRLSFNYAECDPDIEYHREIPAEIMEDIESKWRGGVFEIHHFLNSWDLTYDSLNIEKLFQ